MEKLDKAFGSVIVFLLIVIIATICIGCAAM